MAFPSVVSCRIKRGTSPGRQVGSQERRGARGKSGVTEASNRLSVESLGFLRWFGCGQRGEGRIVAFLDKQGLSVPLLEAAVFFGRQDQSGPTSFLDDLNRLALRPRLPEGVVGGNLGCGCGQHGREYRRPPACVASIPAFQTKKRPQAYAPRRHDRRQQRGARGRCNGLRWRLTCGTIRT